MVDVKSGRDQVPVILSPWQISEGGTSKVIIWGETEKFINPLMDKSWHMVFIPPSKVEAY